MLKYTEETVKVTDYGCVEDLINEVFQFTKDRLGRGYELLPQEECGTSQYLSYLRKKVDGKVDQYDMADIQKALDTKETKHLNFRLQSALDYCCSIGKIEPGEYFIEVYW